MKKRMLVSSVVALGFLSVVPIAAMLPPPVEIDIDIKPGSYPNSVNIGSQGVLPVSLMCALDPPAVAIAIGAVAPVKVEPTSDGYMLHFSTPELVSEGELTASTTSLTVTVDFADGSEADATDSIVVRGRP